MNATTNRSRKADVYRAKRQLVSLNDPALKIVYKNRLHLSTAQREMIPYWALTIVLPCRNYAMCIIP
jgi:hypothetical protein